jgi:hypothetical protein
MEEFVGAASKQDKNMKSKCKHAMFSTTDWGLNQHCMDDLS